eukprot:6203555-Pleurochrysis_carterae.AAC.2
MQVVQADCQCKSVRLSLMRRVHRARHLSAAFHGLFSCATTRTLSFIFAGGVGCATASAGARSKV